MYKLIINLKTYKESTGEHAKELAQVCNDLREAANEKNVELILCPELIDIKDLVSQGVSIYSQHIDVFDYGAHTGYVVPETLKELGVKGTLISHSEHILPLEEIEVRVKKCQELGLMSCVCARDVKAAKEIAQLNPDYIAVEPQELIGGDISISTARPELIKESLDAVGSIPLLVGAGVKNSDDVKKAVEMGAKGILVASGVVKAGNMKEAVEDLLSGF